MPAPKIAVIGLPGLARALIAAGYDVLAGGSTGAAEVTAAVREAAATERPYVAIVAGSEPALRQWVALQLRRQVAVLVACSDLLGFDEPPPGARTVELPADLDTIMACFGAPARGAPTGTVVVGADGGLPGPEPTAGPRTHPSPSQPVLPPPSPFETGPPAVRPQTAPAQTAPAQTAPAQPAGHEPEPPPAPAPAGQHAPPLRQPGDLRPPVPTERGWVAPVRRSEILPETLDPEQLFRPQAKPAPAASSSTGSSSTGPSSTGPSRTRRAPVVITFSGKGGVGKTATALALAQRAARKGGLARVLLVDANRGQGDVRKYLRLRGGALPSVFDAAASGEARRAIVTPKQLNAARDEALAPLGFGVVLAPDDEHADPGAVPTTAYRAVVEYARARFDLVVLDTQIVEAADTSGLIDDLVVPLLCEGAYGVALSDTSMAGVSNTLARVNMLIARGVSRDHLMLGVNRASPSSGLDEGLMRRRCELLATWVGMVANDPKVASAFEQGYVPGDPDAPETPAYTALLDAVLHRATGLVAFDAHLEVGEKPRRRSGGLFRRRS
jgi:Mrp family chromosome partitioning ATPase